MRNRRETDKRGRRPAAPTRARGSRRRRRSDTVMKIRRRAGRLQTLLGLSMLTAGFLGGVVAGGHGPYVADSIGAAAGLKLEAITVSGQRETSDSAILAALGVYHETTLLGFDAGAARDRLEALPWIEDARVRVILPGELQVEIEERAAFARWSGNGRTHVIAEDGRILSDEAGPVFASLPLLAGHGAQTRAREAVDLLADYDALARRTVAMVRINDRRWDLMLETGATVKLPAQDTAAALTRLAELDARHAVLSRAVTVVDLRLADRTTVRLAPEALDEDGTLPDRPTVAEARI